jgi:hypothetical protein
MLSGMPGESRGTLEPIHGHKKVTRQPAEGRGESENLGQRGFGPLTGNRPTDVAGSRAISKPHRPRSTAGPGPLRRYRPLAREGIWKSTEPPGPEVGRMAATEAQGRAKKTPEGTYRNCCMPADMYRADVRRTRPALTKIPPGIPSPCTGQYLGATRDR